MNMIDCNAADHAPQILAIFNEVIANSTALYEYEPRTLAMIGQWFVGKAGSDFPVIGAVDASGQLLGFASYGTFRQFPAYQFTVEHSVYVRTDQRGRGVGEQLLRALLARAQAQRYHTMIGVIDADNAASIRLHEKLGFECAGTLRAVGFKFDRWLDVVLYQRVLVA